MLHQNQFSQPGQVSPARASWRRRLGFAFGTLLLGGVALAILATQYRDLQGRLLPIDHIFLVGVSIIAVVALVSTLLAVLKVLGGNRGNSVYREVLFTFLALCLVLAILAAIFFPAPEVDMTRTGFVQHSLVITEGQQVVFVNPPDGITQILCAGFNQHCYSGNGDPSVLYRGLRIQPGQTVTLSFGGDTEITSETVPNMNLSIQGVS